VDRAAIFGISRNDLIALVEAQAEQIAGLIEAQAQLSARRRIGSKARSPRKNAGQLQPAALQGPKTKPA
jgi:hypothetical protein